MTAHKLNVEDLIKYSQENWSQKNIDAGSTAVRLIRAGDVMLASRRRFMEQFDLTPAEFDTLCTLRKMGAPYKLTPSELCRANLLSSGGLTKIINQLEERGLLSRDTHETDKRSRVIGLTAAGKKLIEESMTMVLQQHETNLEAIYTPAEREELNRLLQKFHLADSYGPTDAC